LLECLYLPIVKIAIIGYGKMGREIEQIALERGHEVTYRINSSNAHQLSDINRTNTDVCIEFTTPETAFRNLVQLAGASMRVICGSTGWYAKLDIVESEILSHEGALIAASNFSLGVNLFFEAAEFLAGIMSPYPEYDTKITETHHIAKLDAPSGTALTLARRIRKQMDTDVPIESLRLADVPGSHQLSFENEIDKIELTHTAYSRRGFALGAVMAAEFINGKSGIFSIKDVLASMRK